MLKSISFPKSTTGENPLKFPAPTEYGSVTVLCGPNGSGKSFILRALSEVLAGKKAGYLKGMSGWSVETTGDTSVAAFKPQHHSSQMNSIGTMSLEQGTKVPRHNDDPLRLKVQLFGTLLASVDGLPPQAQSLITAISQANWRDDASLRSRILSEIQNDEERVYWTTHRPHEVFSEFESATGFKLGLRRAVGTFELVVAYKDGSAADYGNWSDGQKSLFSIISAVVLQNPQVYIFDEIENYLHPAYMTYALEFLRAKVPQTVIASHHPHLIFGRSVDEVYYIERRTPKNPRFATSLKKQIHQETPARTITRLANNHLKLANAYRLFDLKDSALMAAAANVSDSISYAVYDAVYHLYECHAAGANVSPFPDRQSQGIADLVLAHGTEVKSVLDWGAGLGRVLKESQKLGKGHSIRSASWILYDPTYAVGDQVGSSTDGVVTRVADRRDLASLKVDVGLLTNVLHILPPSAWAEAVCDLWKATQTQAPGKGVILVTEIFPLLSPERNAVPIPRHLMEDFFRGLGFKVYGRDFEVQGAKSYSLVLSENRFPVMEVKEIVTRVEALWVLTERHLQSLYDSAPQVESPATRNEILNAAFGIASIRGKLNPASM